jgi:hypothetical protein
MLRIVTETDPSVNRTRSSLNSIRSLRPRKRLEKAGRDDDSRYSLNGARDLIVVQTVTISGRELNGSIIRLRASPAATRTRTLLPALTDIYSTTATNAAWSGNIATTGTVTVH